MSEINQASIDKPVKHVRIKIVQCNIKVYNAESLCILNLFEEVWL